MRSAYIPMAALVLAAAMFCAGQASGPASDPGPASAPAPDSGPATQAALEAPATAPATAPASQPIVAEVPATAPASQPASAPALSAREPSPTAAAPAPTVQPAAGGKKPAYDDYRLISERNIFAKDRSRTDRPERTERPPTPPPAAPAAPAPAGPPRDSAWVLCGVAVHRNTEMAFLENTVTGEMLRVPVGQPAGSGKIVSVCLDSVQYCCGETTRTIEVGQNLLGQVPTLGAYPAIYNPSALAAPQSPSSGGAVASAGGESSSTTKPATPSDKAVDDIAERMRLRRLQELQK